MLLNDELAAKANKFKPENVIAYIKNLQITPNWIDPHRFWFCYQTDAGYEFKLAHCHDGKIQPLFDHTIIAENLSQLLKAKIKPTCLPITIQYWLDDSTCIFEATNNYYRCDINTNSVQKYEEFVPQYPSRSPSAMQAWGLLPCMDTDILRSPDGKWDLKLNNYNLELISTVDNTRKMLTQDGTVDFAYALSPNCNLATITNSRANKNFPPIAIWSADSSKILTHKVDQRHVTLLPYVQHCPDKQGDYQPKLWQLRMPCAGDEVVTTTQLCIIDVLKNQVAQIDTPPILSTMIGSSIESNYAWFNHDASKVFFIREHRANKQMDFCVADSTTGKAKLLLTEQANTYVETSNLLFWINYTYTLTNCDEAIWLSERDGWMQLYLVDTKQGGIKHAITQGEFCVRKVCHVDEDNRYVYFLASGVDKQIDPYLRQLYRASLNGDDCVCLTPAAADHTIYFSPRGDYFISNASTMDSVPTATLHKANGELIAVLTQANFEALFNLGWQYPEPFTAKAADGVTDLYGLIYRPTNFDPNKKYAIIDDIYPGPQMIRTAKSYLFDPPEYLIGPWWSQCYAELGFIVVNIDGRGTPLRSKAFHDYSHNNMQSAGGLEDHIAVIKQLAERYDFLDTNRVGIVGWSQGGYAAARAILQYPDFYKVAIAFAGDHELRSYLSFWGEKVQTYPVDKNFDLYSNASLAKQLQGKLFLIHGELDDNVHPAGTFSLVNALIQADKDFDLLIVPNENHSGCFMNTYIQKRMWGYFATYL